MAKPTLKDLRTTYRVLSKFDEPVPQSLLVALADKIKAEEKSRTYRKIARMTEEDLIRFQATPKRRLRINLPDGRIIQEKKNENTFFLALKEIDFNDLLSQHIILRGMPLFVGFKEKRKQLTHYKMLKESCFVLRSVKPEERMSLLKKLDEALQLNWDIELI